MRLGPYRLISALPLIRSRNLGILYKHCSVGILGSVLSIFAQFPLNLSQHVMVDSGRSKLVNVLSGVP